jgi:hypothetical protein
MVAEDQTMFCVEGDTMSKTGSTTDSEQYSVRVDKGIPDAMKATLIPGMNVGKVWTLACRIWLDMPEGLRKKLLMGEEEPDLVAMIERIVDERIAAGKRAGEDLAKRHKRTRGQVG